MSIFVLDASYALTWCFPDRATAAADETLRRLEAGADTALVPWIWQLEIGNALGKAVARGKATLPQVIELWEELMLLPIRHEAPATIPQLLQLAVQNNLSIYDTCYLQTALGSGLPLATNDERLRQAANANGLETIAP